jgi:hypothetical protein
MVRWSDEVSTGGRNQVPGARPTCEIQRNIAQYGEIGSERPWTGASGDGDGDGEDLCDPMSTTSAAESLCDLVL